jgi:HSP20 family protein
LGLVVLATSAEPFDVSRSGAAKQVWAGVPAVDIAEKEKEYEVTAELPGIDENNIDVKFADGMLTIKGEKKEEKEEKKKDYFLWAFERGVQ